MKQTKISIVIPVHNRADDLKKSVHSCLNQSIPVHEILLVDDASTDHSVKVIQELATNYPVINTLFNPKNLGTYLARQKGAMASSGDYVLFLDPDDYLEPSCIEELQKVLVNSDPDIIFFGIKKMGIQSRIRAKAKLPPTPLYGNNILNHLFIKMSPPPGTIGGKVYKRDTLIKACNLVNIQNRFIYMEDCFLLFSVAALSSYALSLNKELYCYVINTSSISSNVLTSASLKAKLKQLDYARDMLKQVCYQLAKFKTNNSVMAASRKFNAYIESTIYIQKARYQSYLAYSIKAWIKYPNKYNALRPLIYIFSLGKIKK